MDTIAGLLRRRLWIMDRHNSHVTSNSVGIFFQNGLNLVSLPFHTLYITQPLDMGISGPSKAVMACQTSRLVRYDPGKIQRTFLAAHARSEAMSEQITYMGWSITGLRLLYPYKVLSTPLNCSHYLSSNLQRRCRLFLLSLGFWPLLTLLADTNCVYLIKIPQG